MGLSMKEILNKYNDANKFSLTTTFSFTQVFCIFSKGFVSSTHPIKLSQFPKL